MEEWKDVNGCEGIFKISNYGNVKSLERITKNGINSKRLVKERILKNNISKTGYYVVDLKVNNKRKTFKVHRLIALHFIEKVENKDYVNHIDGDKLNNAISNLEWCTIKENNNHAINLGLVKNRGVNNSKSKLNSEDVIFIRNSNLKLKELAIKFNMCESGISKIKLNKTYKTFFNSE
jgi:hypothetical protein